MPLQELLQQIIMSLLKIISILLDPVILVPTIIIIILLVKNYKDYKKGAYYQVTKTPYFTLRNDIGKYGEYLTYKQLKSFEKDGSKFLFNIYIPKQNSETTEIDVLMLSPKGIFVFESKNFSGWIFGSESQKNWYQTLPKGRGRSHKEQFYNPIMQNRSHIKHLKSFIGEQIPLHSVIVFSDRCTLKSIQLNSSNINVINRYKVASVVIDICAQTPNNLLSENDINIIYNKLYPYTQVDNTVKTQHIANIHNNISSEHIQKLESPSVEDILYDRTEIIPDRKNTEITNENTQETPDETSDVISNEPKKVPQKETAVLKCPICNSDLVLRTATRGTNKGKQLYGCSNYPKCRYIQNI